MPTDVATIARREGSPNFQRRCGRSVSACQHPGYDDILASHGPQLHEPRRPDVAAIRAGLQDCASPRHRSTIRPPIVRWNGPPRKRPGAIWSARAPLWSRSSRLLAAAVTIGMTLPGPDPDSTIRRHRSERTRSATTRPGAVDTGATLEISLPPEHPSLRADARRNDDDLGNIPVGAAPEGTRLAAVRPSRTNLASRTQARCGLAPGLADVGLRVGLTRPDAGGPFEALRPGPVHRGLDPAVDRALDGGRDEDLAPTPVPVRGVGTVLC